MARFRKRPVEVEATQWFENGDHPLDYSRGPEEFDGIEPERRRAEDWEGDIVRRFRHPEVAGAKLCSHAGCGRIMHDHGWIDTPEGGHIVCPGDWIITGVAGERYPCKPAIFSMTYEEIG